MIIKANENAYYVFIVTDQKRIRLEVGSTGNLDGKIIELKTAVPNTNLLVYYEGFSNAAEAMYREEALNKMSLRKKRELIDSVNPEWGCLTKESFVKIN